MKLTNKIKMKIARLSIDPVQLLIYLKSLQTGETHKTGTNGYYLDKFVNWLEYGGKLPFNVFKVGNKKLPFFDVLHFAGGKLPGGFRLFGLLLFLERLEVPGGIFWTATKYFTYE